MREWKLRSPCSRNEDRVFPTFNGVFHKQSTAILKFWYDACDKAGNERVHFRSLRHYFATILFETYPKELDRIAELDEKLGAVNVGQLELADGEIVGLQALREVGRSLYGPPESLPDTIGPHAIGAVLHHEVHRGMVGELEDKHERIQLHFPGLERSDLSLRSEEGVLFVGVNGREQAIPTETHVKSSLVKASLEGDVLSLLIPRTAE